MPIYYTLHGLGVPLASRFGEVGRTEALLEEITADSASPKPLYVPRLKEAFRVYVNLPEYRALYYAGDHPLLLEYVVPFFLLGAAFLLWRIRTPAFLVFLWVVATSLGNSLIADSSVSTRFVVAFPALALLTAVGIRYTLSLLWPPQLPDRYQVLPLAVLGVVLAVGQTRFYFGPQLERYNEQWRATTVYDGQDALFRSADFPPGTQVFIIADRAIDQGYGHGILVYLADNVTLNTATGEEMTPQRLQEFPRNVDFAFFLARDDSATLERIRRYFFLLPPQETPYDVPKEKALVLYYAPAERQRDFQPEESLPPPG
jgi:hypothetical protein